VASGEIGDVNHRTHRKVLICDERVSFTGGVGIADEWNGDARDETEWRDTHFRIVGPATDGLRGAFIDNWAETQGELFDPDVDRFPPQPVSGPSTVQVVRGAAETGSSDVSTMFRVLVQLARRRLRITTAYFNPDDLLLGLLIDAAVRGVDVDILLPGPHADKRFVQLAGEATYAPLLEHGVKIWCFQPSMLHAKILTIDDIVASVGSSNVNNRSTQYDEEVNLVVFDPDLVATLDRHFDEDLTRSVALDPERWQDRSVVQKAAEKVVGTVARLI
jgi:cardiolipin synthase